MTNDLVLARDVARDAGLRPASLAKATREGRGPSGRILLADNLAAYPRAAVEEWLERRIAAAPARLEAARARAAHARAVRAARRAGGASR
ncbi:hypothetical protein BAC2_00579 [uncultured bacterium]|nr:hypothetical protein BAC2_00579 [uncultured bacterium]